MTRYHGGKQRIGKEIAEIIADVSLDIEDDYEFTIKGYCEPFCGMLGVYQHIPKLFEENHPPLKYKAGDTNESVIKMWKASQRGWKPPTSCSKTKFTQLKHNNTSSAEKGFIGHTCTFRGVFFDGYFNWPNSTIKNNSIKVSKIGSEMSNVKFSSGSYNQFSNLKNFVIYCDPPYANTEQRYYKGIGYTNRLSFDSEAFWNWCRKMSKDNIVFISEYKAPRDFINVFSSSHKITGTPGTLGKKRVEKLFLMY